VKLVGVGGEGRTKIVKTEAIVRAGKFLRSLAWRFGVMVLRPLLKEAFRGFHPLKVWGMREVYVQTKVLTTTC
jgi:hypothetical protein